MENKEQMCNKEIETDKKLGEEEEEEDQEEEDEDLDSSSLTLESLEEITSIPLSLYDEMTSAFFRRLLMD